MIIKLFKVLSLFKVKCEYCGKLVRKGKACSHTMHPPHHASYTYYICSKCNNKVEENNTKLDLPFIAQQKADEIANQLQDQKRIAVTVEITYQDENDRMATTIASSGYIGDWHSESKT